MTSMGNDYFSTHDLYLGALVYSKGVKFEGIKREGKQCWFVFADKQKCEELQQKFFAKEIEVNAKDYTDSVRTLKNLLFSEN